MCCFLIFITTGLAVGESYYPPQRQGAPVLKPVDESALNASFHKFWKVFGQAVKARDSEEIVSHTSRDIQVSLGPAEFSEGLRHLLQNESHRWLALDQMLSLGAVQLGDDTYCAPSLWCLLVEQGNELLSCPHTSGVISREGALVFSKLPPFEGSEEQRRVSYAMPHEDFEVLCLLEEIEKNNSLWYKVAFFDNKDGYIHSYDFITVFDYRAYFERNAEGVWKMTVFLAGD